MSHGVATPPLLPTLTVYYREVPLLGFRLVWCWSGVSVAFALIARTIPAPVLVQPCAVLPIWRFFPQFRGFRASFGDFCPCFGILALPLLFLGYAYGVAFFAPSAYISAYLYPAVASLVGFSCGPPSLVVPVCVCGVSF